MIIEKGSYTHNNWNIENTQILAYEINLINKIYSRYFNHFDVSNLIVSFDTSTNSEAPICYKVYNSIILNADIKYWCQVAYQYCHELCHYCILGHTDQKFKWLEESICELSSVYFMDILAKEWSNGQLYPEYSVHIKDYANNLLSSDQCKKFNLIDLTNGSKIFKLLASNQYLRDYNKTIAKKLLQTFKKNPILWDQITKIGFIHNAQSLEGFLNEWGKIINSSDASILILESFTNDESFSLGK